MIWNYNFEQVYLSYNKNSVPLIFPSHTNIPEDRNLFVKYEIENERKNFILPHYVIVSDTHIEKGKNRWIAHSKRIF